MRIEEATKRFWAGCLTMMLVMFANFYLYISPHPCEGSASMCDTISFPNGTLVAAIPGEVPSVTHDSRGPLFVDFLLLAVAWVLAMVYVFRRKTNAKISKTG